MEKQKAYHIGEDRDPPYPFPDMTYHVALYDRFFIRDTISSPCPIRGLGYYY